MSPRRIAIVSFFAGIVVVGGGLLLMKFWRGQMIPETPVVREPDVAATSTPPAEEQWTTYRNDIFGFSIEHPASWEVAERNANGTPMISIYKPGSHVPHPGSIQSNPPFSHWDTATHVSMYPSGIPTEGAAGFTQPNKLDLHVEVKQANDYLAFPKGTNIEQVQATNGDPWATFISFENPPTNWKPWGFVWVAVALPDMSTLCLRNGETVDEVHCDPLAGDQVIHIGTPNPTERAIEERMLTSLRFAD
jgi:hypothetical protein